MPTYEYTCSSCSTEWEHEQSIKDDPLKECPACHKDTARRMISRGAGFILKGGGWYSDLYASPSNSKPPEGGGGGAGAKGDAKSSEAKPAASTDTSSSTGSTPSSGGETKSSVAA